MDRRIQIVSANFQVCFSRPLNSLDRRMQILSASFKVLFQQVFNCCYGSSRLGSRLTLDFPFIDFFGVL